MARQVINPKQTQQKASYMNQQGIKVVFDKTHGYYFSDDAAMDEEVKFFVEEKGFELVGAKKEAKPKLAPEQPKEEPKKEVKVEPKKEAKK